MRIVRRIGLLTLLFAVTFFVQTASATLAPILPDSSYADGQWQGFEWYNEEIGDGVFLNGRVDYAVYDTFDLQYQDESEWVDGLDLSGEGQFLYVYQIFNDYEDWSDREVAYFSVFAESGDPLDVEEDSIGSSQDPENGVGPVEGYLADSGLEIVWKWEMGPEGNGYIIQGKYSWFLLFLSDSQPVPGDFEVRASEGEGEFPISSVPEPATVALLGLGNIVLVLNRRKFHRRKRTK
ncbi:PEP-CTERM sorting domain-containing protein [Planctomycetota bacterium]